MTLRKAWKKFWQGIFHLGIIQWIIVILIAIPIWFIYATCRLKITNYETYKKYRARPAIFAFWHGRALLLSPIICIGRMRSFVIASRHADGRLMAKLQRLFGLRAVYGSSTKGGVSVVRDAIKVLQRGDYSMCISPDGPSGPSLRVQMGTVYIAKMTGAPIIPVCYSASRARFMNHWDKFMIPMPFCRATCRVAAPIFVKPDATDAEMEAVRKHVEDVMVQQIRQMDAEFNLPVIEQDLKSGEYKRQQRAERDAKRAARHAAKHGENK